MKIVHFAPFAPNGSGMYEAARDMVHADVLMGHRAYLVDTGSTPSDSIFPTFAENPKDDRGGFNLPIISYEEAQDADVMVGHVSMPDDWIVSSRAPLIWMLHGRPLDCFRTEQNYTIKKSYSWLAQRAKWPRVKKMVTMWQEHVPYWQAIIPPNKLICLDPPPMDETRFCKEGIKHVIQGKDIGDWNILIADSWREDVDTYEIMTGAIEASKHVKGIRIHNYAMKIKQDSIAVVDPWNLIFDYATKLGAQGEIYGRVGNMEQIYRSMDIVLTPHRIATRIVGEALCCGIPVITGSPSQWSRWWCIPEDAISVVHAIINLTGELRNSKGGVDRYVKQKADMFSLASWGRRINALYNEVV